MCAGFERENVAANFVLVTLDPRNDTPARLRVFKDSHGLAGDRWHLLAGTEKQTRELGRMLGARASYDDNHIDHDVRILVFDQDGRLLHHFHGWSFDAEATLLGGAPAPAIGMAPD
jgi:protein SCO1/2